MKQRRVTEIRTAHPARDGDGVAIRRIAGMGHAGMDPILMVDELRPERHADIGGGFPPHPHRGMQTLTYMKQGGILHEDSQGNRGEIRGGGAQWMSAGRGIIHSEMPTADTDGFHGFQIWVNLPAADKFSAPRYRDVSREELALARGSGFEATAVAGHWRLAGEGEDTIALHGPLEELAQRAGVLDLSLQPATVVELDTPATESVIGFVYQGAVVHHDAPVGSGCLLITDRGDRWRLRAGPDGAGVLLLRGQPLREPVAHYGPFVMNTAGEIEQAIRDFRAGKFA